MRKWMVIIIIGILVVGCSTLSYVFVGKINQLDAANVEIESLSGTVSKLDNNISVLEEDIGNLNNTIEETNANLDLANEKIGSLEGSLKTVEEKYMNTASELAELQEFYEGIFRGEPPPYIKPGGQPMNMINLSSAQDPTWQQLINFLNTDQTDRREYVLNEYVCSGFTEDIHNNAEAIGIRCAIVHVEFEDAVVTHVLNAFNTVDRGLVFIDCTGAMGNINRSWDRVAFLRIGKRYGLIHVDTPIQSFEYEYYVELYEQLQQRTAEYELAVSQYNAEMDSYNDEVRDFNDEAEDFEEEVYAYYL